MKIIFNTLLVGFVLTGSLSIAQAEEYPASDFQPKVLYKDESYKPSASTSSSSSSVADPKYPAANFQPKVVYNDPNYKPSKSTKSSGRIKSSSNYNNSPSGSGASTESFSKAEKKEDSGMTVVIGLVALALVGFFYVKNKSGSTDKKPARRKPSYKKAVTSSGEGQTRVAKYLAEKQGGGVTGVAKYLSSKKELASSSVAKYLAKQKVSEKQAASGKSSSVEKYLQNRG